MSKKILSVIALILVFCFCFSGCNDSKEENYKLLRIAVSGDDYDPSAWKAIKTDFESIYSKENVKLEIIVSDEIENIVEPMVSSGKNVDIMSIPQNRPNRYVEQLISSRAILNIDDIMDEKVYGEDVKLKDKLIRGFTDTIATNIYQDEISPDTSVYMLPLSYKTKGVIYNKALFNAEGTDGKFKLPATMDNFLNLRYDLDELNNGKEEADKKYLFGYGKDSDLEHFITTTIATTMGQTMTEKLLSYEYVYNNAKFLTALTNLEKINKRPEVGGGKGDYVLHSSLEGKDSKESIKELISGKVLFIPGGIDEIETIKDELGYETTDFGFMSMFSASEKDQRYVGVNINPIFIMKGSENKEMCKNFLLYLYSDRGSELFIKNTSTMMPVVKAKEFAVSNNIYSENELKTLDCFNNGERPFAYSFRKTDDIGVDWQDLYTRSLTRVFNGAQTAEFWLSSLKTSSVEMRSALVEFNNN